MSTTDLDIARPQAAEDAGGPVSAAEAALVQASFARIAPIAEAAAQLFYTRLFEIDPTLRLLFATDMKEQGRKLMATLKLAVGGLGDLPRLLPAVEELGRRHAGYGVRERDYDTVAAALIWTLRRGLGAGFTPEVEAAWIKVYATLAAVMRDAARGETA